MKTIVLIACVSKKSNKKIKAEDLYISTLFKASLTYAKSLNPDKILILSALHHVIELNEEIEPYNVTLSNVPKKRRKPGLKILNANEKIQWGKKVIDLLSGKTNLQNDKFIILAGQEYIKPINKSIPNLENPLYRLSQGKRVSYLKSQLDGKRLTQTV
jgi:hypothetical protein